jgi:hypothetical protein
MPVIFSKAAVEHFEEVYRNDVRPEHGPNSGGGCMKAVYRAVGALYGEEYDFAGPFHKSFMREAYREEDSKHLPRGRLNSVDRVFEALSAEGITAQRQDFRPTRNGWKEAGTFTASLEQSLVDEVSTLPDGSHFFGMAVSGAYHSVVLRVEKQSTSTRIFWMDQFSNGSSSCRPNSLVKNPDVTGTLDREIRSFGSNVTSIWAFRPEAAVGLTVPVDSNGDGLVDGSAPATTASAPISQLDEIGEETEPLLAFAHGDYAAHIGEVEDEDGSEDLDDFQIAPTEDGHEVLLAESSHTMIETISSGDELGNLNIQDSGEDQLGGEADELAIEDIDLRFSDDNSPPDNLLPADDSPEIIVEDSDIEEVPDQDQAINVERGY